MGSGAAPFPRVLFFGKLKSNTRCTSNLVHALAATGREVRWINPPRLTRWLGAETARRRVEQVLAAFRPDLIFVFFRDLELGLQERLARQLPVVLWIEEFVDPLTEDLKRRAAASALVALSNPAQLDLYRAAGARRAVFVMSAAGPSHFGPPPDGSRKAAVDVVFLGGPGKKGQRAEAIGRLSEHFKVAIHGKTWENHRSSLGSAQVRPPVGPKGFLRACREAAVVLGMSETHELPLYFSNRIWLTLASGAFHLTHYVPRMEELFTAGEHLDWFRGPEECLEKVADYLARPLDRVRIASRGQELVLARHTYLHRVQELFQALDSQA